jgi:ribonuclease T2
MRGRVAAAAGVAFVLSLAGVSAQDGRRDVPGDFDFYVLSLSWSPSYCEAAGGNADRFQCAGGRPYSFVVHGLWPQYEHGWPEFCPAKVSEPPEAEVHAMLDIMPSPDLVRHEWQKHGTCAGLSADGYFELMREARQTVRIPPAFEHIESYVMVEPGAIETAFRTANPGLPADAIAVTCDSRRVREVRICLTKSLAFRACPEVDKAACRLERAVMPPMRGG